MYNLFHVCYFNSSLPAHANAKQDEVWTLSEYYNHIKLYHLVIVFPQKLIVVDQKEYLDFNE